MRRRSGNSSSRSDLCVGIGVAFIGNVPNSILLGRWFGPRLPTAMAVVYSAMGAGVLVLLPASQLLIDHLGWRDAYQMFGIVTLGLLRAAACCCRGGCSPPGSPHVAKKADPDFVDDGWTLVQRDAPPRLLGAVLDLLLHRGRHVLRSRRRSWPI